MSLEDDINLLSKVQLFSDFDNEHLRLIAFGSQKMSFKKNYELYREGQSTDGGYVIISGSIELLSFEQDQTRTLGIFKLGSLLGEMALISANKRVGTAILREDCELMKISRITMHRILTEYPELAATLHNKISESVVNLARELGKVKI